MDEGEAGDGVQAGEEGDLVAELAAFYQLDHRRAVALSRLLDRFAAVRDATAPAADDRDDPEADPAAPADELAAFRRPPPAVLPTPDPGLDLGPDAPELLGWLADPDVAAAFVSQAVGIRSVHAPALLRFATAARRLGPRSIEGATRWLEAKALARLGHPLAAADQLDAAVRLDPELAPLLLDAANLASDRGDAAAAVRHARAAGLDERDDFVRTLEELVPAAPPGIGRNDRCFCGSGRKYKQCHLGRPHLTPSQRAGWLYRKALEWIQDTTWRLRVVEIAGAYAPDEDDPDEVLFLAMTQPLLADLALTEDGAWADFLVDRGPLLPHDELELATTWAGTRRSVYEVVGAEPGASVTVRDRCDPAADPVTVAEATFSRQARPGDVILAHLLPTGADAGFFGGVVSLGPDEDAALIEVLDDGGSGVAVAAALGAMRADPKLTNTEGEPLVFCGATFRLPDPGAAPAALDLEPTLRRDEARPTDGEDEGIAPFDATWLEEITIDGRDWIRSRWTLRDGELVLEANSEARLARARDLLVGTFPGAELVHEEQRPLDELAVTAPVDPRPRQGSGADAGAPPSAP